MRVADFLTEAHVIADLAARDKGAALAEIASTAANGSATAVPSLLLEALWARERTGSTGIGEGVAIPHGKVASLPGIVGCFGRSRQGIPFDSRDGKPSHFIFALLAPEAEVAAYLKALACVAGIFKRGATRDKLLVATTQREIFQLLVADDPSGP